MARGVTLSTLVSRLKAETRFNSSVAANVDFEDTLKQTLRRIQETLYDEYDWPFAHTFRDVSLGAGQRYYDFPSDMDLEKVQRLEVLHAGIWYPVEPGISIQHYNAIDPDQKAATGGLTINTGPSGMVMVTVDGMDISGGAVSWTTSNSATAAAVAAAINAEVTVPNYSATANANRVIISAPLWEGADANGRAVAGIVTGDVTVGSVTDMAGGVTGERSDPVRRWQPYYTTTDQIEVWPLPETSGDILRVIGKVNLPDLVDGADTCMLDDTLLLLFAAAEMLHSQGSKDAQAKLAQAQQRLARLRARTAKSAPVVMGGGDQPYRRYGPTIRVAG